MRRRLLPALVLAAFAMPTLLVARASTCAAAPSSGDWPVYGRDLANTRHQSAETLIAPDTVGSLETAWVFSARAAGGAGDFTGTPVASGGCVFVGSNMGWLFAIDAGSGARVWSRQVPSGGTINNSLAVADGVVYAYISREGSPYVAAFDASDGDLLWEYTVDTQQGSDAFGSPVVFNDIVFVGVSGDAAQHGDEGERVLFFGSVVLLDVNGPERLLARIWTIPPEEGERGFAGATVTTTPAIDPVAQVAYVGTGSPFRPQFEHPHANALLKIDLDRTSGTFGTIVAAYKGDTFDRVVPGYSSLPCTDIPLLPPPPPIVPAGRGFGGCGDVDVDFAASPNLFTDADGRRLVGTSQKSGVFHAVDAAAMTGVWTATIGPAQPFGGVSGAYDGRALYTGAAPPGHMVSLEPADGAVRWIAPVADGAHYGIPAASANGVVFTADLKGFLDAFDAETGAPLAHRPLLVDGQAPTFTFGGVSIANGAVLVSVGIQNTGLDVTGSLDGLVIALRGS